MEGNDQFERIAELQALYQAAGNPITAKGLRKALIADKGWKDEDLPCEKTIGNSLNRLGYRLRRVQKGRASRRP